MIDKVGFESDSPEQFGDEQASVSDVNTESSWMMSTGLCEGVTDSQLLFHSWSPHDNRLLPE